MQQVSSNSMSGGKHNRYHYCVAQYRKTVPIQGISMNTGKRYRYRGSVRIRKNNTVLENTISKDFKLFTTINKRIIAELSSRQADKNASEHPSRARGKLAYSGKCYHARRGYRSQHS